MKLYSIKNWDRYYEVSDSRKVDGPLSWVAVRTKSDGFGFRRIASESDRCELLAAWYLMLGVAARQGRENRGKLMRDGLPLDADDLAIITGFPAQVFAKAFVFFSGPKQNWLDCSDYPDSSEPVRTNPDEAGKIGCTGQDRTGQDFSHTKESDWLAKLKRSYHGINIEEQLRLAHAHCRKSGRKLERAWFELQWLPKASPAVDLAANPKQSLQEPENWREFAESEWPDAVFLHPSSDRYAETWADLDEATQRLIHNQISLVKP